MFLSAAITQKKNFRETRSKVIMHIPGDSGALLFNRVLLFQKREFFAKVFDTDVPDGPPNSSNCGQSNQPEKPPCLPEMREQDEIHGHAGRIPNPVAVAAR